LHDEGYRPRKEAQGDVLFKSEGNTFLLCTCEESDRQFFYLLSPILYEMDEPSEQELPVLRAINRTNEHLKVVKLTLEEGRVFASVELLIDPFTNFSRVFPRALDVLHLAAKEFQGAVRRNE
jgi:hypothetical protein